MDIDSATMARLNLVYPDLKTRVIRVMNDMLKFSPIPMRVSEGIRTFAEQERLYAQGRTTPGKIVTHSQPGDSIHHYGAATDLCFTGSDPFEAKHESLWADFGRIAQAHGLVWGGTFPHLCDRPHVQITYGLNLSQIKNLYHNGGNKAVWAAFDKIRGVPVGAEWRISELQNRVLDPKIPV